MHIREILSGDGTKFSFEFFPPKSEAAKKSLLLTISELKHCDPAFVSVTYGAGGTTRDATRGLVLRLQQEMDLHTIPHLTCIGHSEREVCILLENYATAGVSNILALRGDIPKSSTGILGGDFPNASDLVSCIRRFSEKNGHEFGIGVAGFPEGHPAAPNRMLEMERLKMKIDCGADYICTQLFFDNHDFYDFQDRCELAGIHVPILAGIMPLTGLASMGRIADLAAGSRFPAKLLRALSRGGSDEASIRRIGTHYATAQCSDLLDNGVKGIHFYTLNQSSATMEIFHQLGLRSPETSSY